MLGDGRTIPDLTRGTFLSNVPAKRPVWQLAGAVVLVSGFIFLLIAPSAAMPLEPIAAFIPAYQAALSVVNFIIAVMLLSQYNRSHSWALLALASGYFFNTLLIIAHTLSFPGLFSPGGLLGAGKQTTAWLYVFWHGGFPLFLIGYALLNSSRGAPVVAAENASKAVLGCIAGNVLLCGGLLFLSTYGENLLPTVIDGGNFSMLTTKGITPSILLLCVLAIVALTRQKPVSVLNVWLVVVMSVWICEVALGATLNAGRYDLGWYSGRLYGLLASSFLLAALLIENNSLQFELTRLIERRAETYRKDRERYLQILDQAPIRVAVRDLRGRFMMVNHNLGVWIGERTDSWIGKTTREVFGDTPFAEAHERLDREVILSGGPAQGEMVSPHQDDPRTLLCVKFPLYDNEHQLEAVGSVAIDITEGKRLGAALERFFESSMDLVLAVSPKGEFIKVSPSLRKILGYEVEEFVGRNAVEFIHPDDLENTRKEMRMARRGSATRYFETRYLHKDGHPVTLSWSGIWSEEAKQHFFIGRDMTERLKMEQELRQAQKMEAIGQLTGGIAHDYNNLLTVILGNTELLAEALRDQPQLHSLATLALEAADRSATLTQRLLAFGRRQALSSQDTDLNELLSDMADLMVATLGEQMKIDLRPQPDLWTAKLDRGQFETAILNLGINARDAMPNGGRLVIETGNVTLDRDYGLLNPSAEAGEYVAITVSDNGPGMPPEVLARVFEPFFTTKEVGKGTGLGLSMVYGFVKQSGGHITIYSEPGNGTVVRLYFPRVDAEAVPAQPREDAPSLQMGNELILLVEDDPMVRAHTEMQLSALGYDVRSADKGPTAIRMIEEGLDPDLLFTDVIMPDGMNGRQLADEVLKRKPGIKILFTSGYTQGTVVEGKGSDPHLNFIGKPFRRVELAAKLREILDGVAVAG